MDASRLLSRQIKGVLVLFDQRFLTITDYVLGVLTVVSFPLNGCQILSTIKTYGQSPPPQSPLSNVNYTHTHTHTHTHIHTYLCSLDNTGVRFI